jgi:uncharacterized protein (DUF1499 family)
MGTMNKQISIVLLSFIFLIGCSGSMPKLGINNGQLMPCPKTPNCVNSQATDEKHFIEPIHFIGTHQAAQDRLLKILTAWKRTKITVVQENYIRVEFTSKMLRFVDDVEFYFPSTRAEKKIIPTRSALRVGHSDLGANRKRIEQIRNKFKA